MADVKLGEQVFNGVFTVKLNTTDGGTVEFNQANIDTYIETASGTTAMDEATGVAAKQGDLTVVEQGNERVKNANVVPNIVVFNGVGYRPTEIGTVVQMGSSAYNLYGNPSILNAVYGTDYIDNGLDFAILNLGSYASLSNVFTKTAQAFTFQFVSFGKRTEVLAFEKTITFTIGDNGGSYIMDDFPLGLGDYHEAEVAFRTGTTGTLYKYLCKVTKGTDIDYFGDDACRYGRWMTKGAMSPVYVYVVYENGTKAAIKSATIYAALSTSNEYTISITLRKWEAVDIQYILPPVSATLPYETLISNEGDAMLIHSDVPFVVVDGYLVTPDTGITYDLYSFNSGVMILVVEGGTLPANEQLMLASDVIKTNYELVSV